MTLTIQVADPVIEGKLRRNKLVIAIAIASSGEEDGVITADFNADELTGFVERHRDGDCFERV